MERSAFHDFARLERDHWWFVGRRNVYLSLLADVLAADGALAGAGGNGTGGALRVVDVGCGMGGFLGPLERFGRVVGLELDEDAAAWCRGRGFRRTAVARSDALPLPHGSVDLACLFDVIEHTPDDAAVLAAAFEALAPGGHLVVSVPAYQFLYAHNDRVAHHFRRYTRAGLCARLRAAGLQVRKATYVNCLLGVAIIPAVLALKLKERLVGAPEGTNNLSYPVPRVLNRALASIFSSERHLLRHLDAPFGHSLVAIARRPEATA